MRNAPLPAFFRSLLTFAFFATSGCISSRSAAFERPPETLAEVSAVLGERPARIEFIDGRVVRRAKQVVELMPEQIAWQTYSNAVEDASIHHVERILLVPEMTAGGGAVLGGLASTIATGAVLAYAARDCDDPACIGYGLLLPVGTLIGAVVGKGLGDRQLGKADEQSLVVYQGPVERYLKK